MSKVNGVTGSSPSVTFDHLTSYPLISDLVSYYQSMPLGARSIELSHNIYNQFGKPVISHPLVQNPYSYVYPYAKKVDEMGDSTLSTIDEKFPIVKKTDLNALKSHAHGALSFPFQFANESKDYVFSTYSDEYKKTGGQGLVNTGKAVLSTEIRIAADVYQRVASYLGPKKDKAQGEMEKTADKVTDVASEKTGEAQKMAKQKKNELKN